MTDAKTDTEVAAPPAVTRKMLLMPHEAAERLLPKFKKTARHLRPNDPLMRQDLVQEMCLACLTIRIPMSLSSFCAHAVRRALNYLEKEEQIQGLKRSYKEMLQKKK